MYQDVYIPEQTASAILTFAYRIVTNDVLDWASFHVEVQARNNALLKRVLRDGNDHPDNIRICSNDLGWRTYSFNLTPWAGRTVRLWFGNRNEWDGGWGIWTYVDEVSLQITP